MIKLSFFLSFFVSNLALAANSKLGNVLVSASQMMRDTDRQMIFLTGNVQAVFQNQHLEAESAEINLKTKELLARGNVKINQVSQKIVADKVILNYETNQGTIYDGYITAGNLFFEGDIIYKISDIDYEAVNGTFTACTTCPPAWGFFGERIKARLGGYAHIDNSIFKISDIPFFWLPYFIVPLKTKRQTGFLTPTLDYSELGGAAIAESFFWAIAENQDATITEKFYARRGLKTLVNYRYALTRDSRSDLDVGFLRDKVFPLNADDVQTPYQRLDRWFGRYHHYYELPNGYIQRSNLNLASDLRYARDFHEELPGHGDPALETNLSLTKNSDTSHASIRTDYYLNLLKQNPLFPNQDLLQGNRDAVHRMPTVKYSIVDQRIGDTDAFFRLDSEYTNFARNGYAWDSVKGVAVTTPGKGLCQSREVSQAAFNSQLPPYTGEFNPCDFVRTGQRVEIVPALSYPINFGRTWDVTPALSYHENQYKLGTASVPGAPDPNPYRRYIRTEVASRVRFSRIFESSPGDIKANRYKHEIEPEVTYSTVPWFDQPDHPFLGSSSDVAYFQSNLPAADTDFVSAAGNPAQRLQFDYHDRLSDMEVVSFSLNNKLIRKIWNAAGADYRQIATFKLMQSYDVRESRKTYGRPLSNLMALLDIRLEKFETHASFQYFPYYQITNSDARLRWKITTEEFFQIAFNRTYSAIDPTAPSYVPNLQQAQETLSIGGGINFSIVTLTGSIVYLDGIKAFEMNGFRLQPAGQINSWNYTAYIRPPGNCWGVRFLQELIAGSNETRTSFNFDYQFGG